jgi:hypothetical protein
MKKLISRTLAIATLLSILGVLWYLCHLAMYAMPINYLKPTATAMLFVLLLNAYGRARDNSSETKDKK